MNKKIKNWIPKYYRLKINEFRHRNKFRKTYENQKIAERDFKTCDNKKSSKQIREELKLIKDYWKCYPLHYFRYYLYKKDNQLSKEELINYIPEFYFYNVYLPYYDTKKYDILQKDKNVMDSFFRSLNIPTANTLFKIISGQIYDINHNKITFKVFDEIMDTVNSDKIFVKPALGQGGFGINVFHRINEKFKKDDIVFNYDYLKKISHEDDWIIQEGIDQHEELNKINPSSVNTFRIITKNEEGNVKILVATLRIGINQKEVDNSAQGAISCKINLQNGAFNNFATSEHPYKKYIKHPNTNIIFNNYFTVHYTEIKNFVVNSARKLPYFKIISWDIALSKNNILAIEFNLSFGIDHLQYCCNGVRKQFEIEDPNFYWNYYKGIK